ncbi:immunoglobulin-like domain-containing protein [Paenilisteria weihenstephanensis]|nr:immunoglobulin-like domain-containing protein [Listeria weihenstephanensis]
MKKMMSTLAILSLLGTTVMTPFQILAGKGLAAENPEVTPAAYVVDNPSLIDQRTGIVYATGPWKYQKGTTISGSATLAVDANNYFTAGTVVGLGGAGASPTVKGTTIAFLINSANLLTTNAKENNVAYIAHQEVRTVPGKEYTLTGNETRNKSSATLELFSSTTEFGVTDSNNQVIASNKTTAVETNLGTATTKTTPRTITFTATSDVTKVFYKMDAGTVTYAYVNGNHSMSALNLVKSVAQIQKEADEEMENQAIAELALSNLFVDQNPDGELLPEVTVYTIDDVQNLIAVIQDTTKKAELQTILDRAKAELEVLENADKARQELAESALNALFENGNSADVINAATDAKAIADVQTLIDAVVDSAIRAELQLQLDEANGQLEAREAAGLEERTRQQEAETGIQKLFIDEDVAGTIKVTTDDAAIEAAQERVDSVMDRVKKAELQAQLDEAKQQLTAQKEALEDARLAAELAAKTAVNELFQDDKPVNDIKPALTQAEIDRALEFVADITDITLKEELEASINKAQTALTAMIPIVGQAATYQLGDLYITGTYTGAATGMSIDVNGKRYYGGTVESGTLKFYGLDKITQDGDVVTVNLYDDAKQVKHSFPLQVKSAWEVALADYKLGDNYIKATYTGEAIAQVGIVVDGNKYWGGEVVNGTVKFYALDKITKADAQVTMNFYDAKSRLLTSKTLKIEALYADDIKTADLKLTDTNIKGSLTGHIKQIAISVNGKMHYGGTISADGTYKFYALDKKIKADDVVVLYGYGPDNKKLAEKKVTISE